MKLKYCTLFLTILIGACASTKITGYKYPAYSSRTYHSVLVFASNVGLKRSAILEKSICNDFQSKGIKCSPFQRLFPPTRQHSSTSVYEGMRKNEFETLLILTMGGDYSSSEVFAYQSYVKLNTYGKQTYGQNSTYPIRSYERNSSMQIELIDAETGDTAWVGEAETKGQGMANTTDRAFNSSITKEVFSTLMRSRLFSRR